MLLYMTINAELRPIRFVCRCLKSIGFYIAAPISMPLSPLNSIALLAKVVMLNCINIIILFNDVKSYRVKCFDRNKDHSSS